MNAVTQIANHLNVVESAVLEVQEWARVLWVRVKGIGSRFVSKKVVQVEKIRVATAADEVADKLARNFKGEYDYEGGSFSEDASGNLIHIKKLSDKQAKWLRNVGGKTCDGVLENGCKWAFDGFWLRVKA